MVEIAKALARKPRILILDEATSALTASDVARVFVVLKRLRAEGLALLYISHRMHEIAELADECTVFRNGRKIETFAAGSKTDSEVVELMIGREYSNVFPPKPGGRGGAAPPMLECRALSWSERLKDISFAVQPGEIVGLGGLDGQGQRELLLALFGVLRGCRGEILVDGRPVAIAQPGGARKPTRIGMALIPEDRKTEGLMLPMSVRDNLSFAALGRISQRGIIDRARAGALVDEMIELLAIKHGRHRDPGRHALRRQPAEGRDRQMADATSRASFCSTTRRAASTSAPSRRSTSSCAGSPTTAPRSSSIRPTMTSSSVAATACSSCMMAAIKRELVGAGITERALIASRAQRRRRRGRQRQRLR